MSRPVLVLLGLAALAALVAVCVAVQGPHVEAYVAARATEALQESGIAVPSVRVSGRDVTLGGTVASVADRVQAAEAVGRVRGVRIVRDRTRSAPTAARMPEFSLRSDGDTLVLRGRVATADLRAALSDSLDLVFPERTLRNQMSLSPSATGRWQTAVQRLFPLLPQIGAPGVSVENRTVVLRGEAATGEDKARLDAEAQRAVGAPYAVRSEITVRGAADATGTEAPDEQVVASGDARVAGAEAALRQALGGTPVRFESGTQRLTPESRARLDGVAAVFARFPSVGATLTGHTDDDGGARGNRRLSIQRAEATRDYLVSKGVAAERFSVGGRGETEPVAPNDTEVGRARNRRVVFSLCTF